MYELIEWQLFKWWYYSEYKWDVCCMACLTTFFTVHIIKCWMGNYKLSMTNWEVNGSSH